MASTNKPYSFLIFSSKPLKRPAKWTSILLDFGGGEEKRMHTVYVPEGQRRMSGVLLCHSRLISLRQGDSVFH